MNKNRLIRDEDDAIGEESQVAALETAPLYASARMRKGGRGPYPGRRQVTAHIDEQLFKWLRSISVQTETPMVQLFEQALAVYVKRFAVQKKIG
jgi:hypothetical protein